MRTSAITLARGRRVHLLNLVRGLTRQTHLPVELVIGVMQDEPFENLPQTPFPITQVLVPGNPARLARARNLAANKATGEALVFLDVDCIPAPYCLEDYALDLCATGGLKMGEVGYLPRGAARPGWTYDALDAVAERHCDRRGPPSRGKREICEDYRCFWSLNFAMRAATWRHVGGFDERYEGYGGEDTDFGRVVATAGVPLWWIKGGKVYHQHHPQHMPPVHHIESVVANALRFREKWGEVTMGHWLWAFECMGLLGHHGEDYHILRDPTDADFALTRQASDQAYVSASWVVRELEARQKHNGAVAAE